MKKLMTILCVCGLLVCSISAIPANAEDLEDVMCTESAAMDAEERASNLLDEYWIRVSNYNGSLFVTTKTTSTEPMQTIGIKDLTVQYSHDGSQWYDEWNAGDFLAENTNSYELNGYIISLEHNAKYYRAVCKHYAKKSFFSTQSIETVSNSVAIN